MHLAEATIQTTIISMFVNEIDSLIDNFTAYAKQFKKITRRKLKYSEWIEIRSYLKNRQILKPPVVSEGFLRTISDLYGEIFERFGATHAHIPMLVRAIWAEHIGIISNEELDEINRKWRTAR